MQILSVRISYRGLIAWETIGEIFGATKALKGRQKGGGDCVPGRIRSKDGEAEAGRSEGYVQDNLENLEKTSFRADLHSGEEHW